MHVILSAYEMNQRIEQQARERALKAQAATPLHTAAEAGMEGQDGDEDQAEEVRERVRHLADPYPPDAPEVAHADLGKLFRDAVNVPTGYPLPGHVSPEAFRRGPVTAGEAAYGVSYDPSARPVPVPSSALSAASVTRPLITDGRSAAAAEG